MATTTSYGTWNNHGDRSNVTVEATVTDCIAEYLDDYDFDAIVAEYREAINDALPNGVAICGDEFIGPYYEADCDFDDYQLDEDGQLDIKAIIAGIDVWKIIAKHDKTAD